MGDTSNIELKADLEGVRLVYGAQDYKIAAERAESLLRTHLSASFKIFFDNLDTPNKKIVLDEIEAHPDLTGSRPDEYSLSQLAILCDLTKCLGGLATSDISESLLASFSLVPLVTLVREAQTSERATDKRLLRLGLQQIVQYSTLLSYLRGAIELTEAEFIDSPRTNVRGTITEEFKELGFKETFFLYNEERGLLLNRADQERNVAFKVETFSNLLTQIFQEIRRHLAEHDGGFSQEEIPQFARSVVETAGKDSGARFGHALHLQFQREGKRLSLSERISKWCDFDSDVGFGRFDSKALRVTEEESIPKVDGEIMLAENFLTLGRKMDEDNICCFMKGYIGGVLQELAGIPIKVIHKKQHCAQFHPDRDTCSFVVQVDEEGYKKRVNALREVNMDEDL